MLHIHLNPLVALASLWLFAFWMIAMIRWLPERLERLLFGKSKKSPVKRTALVITFEGSDLNR